MLLPGRVGLDVGAQGLVDVQGLVDAGVEHAKPVGGGFLEIRRGEQVAGLDDDLEGVREIVSHLADFDGELFRDEFWGRRRGQGSLPIEELRFVLSVLATVGCFWMLPGGFDGCKRWAAGVRRFD